MVLERTHVRAHLAGQEKTVPLKSSFARQVRTTVTSTRCALIPGQARIRVHATLDGRTPTLDGKTLTVEYMNVWTSTSAEFQNVERLMALVTHLVKMERCAQSQVVSRVASAQIHKWLWAPSNVLATQAFLALNVKMT